MLPADSHELPLPAGRKPQTELWSENFALAMSDTVNGISFLHSIGTWYGDTTVWREKLSVAMPGGRVLVGRNYGRNTEGNVVSASLSRYEILEHERSVRLTWDGPIFNHGFDELMTRGSYGGLAKLMRLDVTFQPSAPIWLMSKGDDATGIAGAMHTEQLGHCAGTLAYEGQTYTIADAFSCRDHSRGKRDFAPYKEHCWMNGEFPGQKRGFQLYATNIYGHDGPALSTAVIADGDTLHPATIRHIEFIKAEGDHGTLQTVILDSDLGEMTIRSTRSLTCLPVSVVQPFEAQAGVMRGQPHGLIFDETIELDWNGHKGIGWTERGFAPNPG